MIEQEEISPAEDTSVDTAKTQSDAPKADPFVGITADLVDVGRSWARHGLGIGQQALVQAARTLELTAATLERVSERLRPNA
jgi:hypothetical protein